MELVGIETHTMALLSMTDPQIFGYMTCLFASPSRHHPPLDLEPVVDTPTPSSDSVLDVASLVFRPTGDVPINHPGPKVETVPM
jgi:hypothetical protein